MQNSAYIFGGIALASVACYAGWKIMKSEEPVEVEEEVCHGVEI